MSVWCSLLFVVKAERNRLIVTNVATCVFPLPSYRDLSIRVEREHCALMSPRLNLAQKGVAQHIVA